MVIYRFQRHHQNEGIFLMLYYKQYSQGRLEKQMVKFFSNRKSHHITRQASIGLARTPKMPYFQNV
jgi:hypothetical protein